MLTRTPGSVTLFVGILYVLLPYIPAEDAGGPDDRLPQLFCKGTFLIESKEHHKCIAVESSEILLKECKQLSENMLWRWASRRLLFNMGSSRCLGLNLSGSHTPLEMLQCDSPDVTQRWRLTFGILMGNGGYKVVAVDGRVVASKTLYHEWRQYMPNNESFCEQSSQEIYSLRGNGLGQPCLFPFKYKNIWYHECTNSGREDRLYWCSTTMNYDRDGTWGYCPHSEAGCGLFWEQNNATQTCYQFNSDASVTWFQARASCQEQGGDLLSITDVDEWKYISERLSNQTGFWIGINDLNGAAGWQWSDGSPLALLASKSDLQKSPSLVFERVFDGQCGMLDSHKFRSFPCYLPSRYVCKKYITRSERETFDTWKYYPTKCDFGWYPHNRYCYKLQREELSWDNASAACHLSGSELTSWTSQAEAEIIVKVLNSESETRAWIGMSAEQQHPIIFQWVDGSNVTFTDWQRNEPFISQEADRFCVFAEGTNGQWKVNNCSEKMFSVCKKSGQLDSISENQCGKDWERYGTNCYRIDVTERTFDQASSGYHCASPLATITNRFEQAFVSSMISSKVQTEDTHFWIGLQDRNNSGEYMWVTNGAYEQAVTFTNWNKGHPNHLGGCAAVRNGKHLGRWEVKDCNSFKAKSLCKKTLAGVTKKPSDSSENSLDSNHMCDLWESEPHFHHCYKVYHHEKVIRKRTWLEAEGFCQAYGAHLVSFSHIEEERFVAELVDTMFHGYEERQFWIGFNKRNPSSEGSWEWSDGSPVVSSLIEDTFDEDESLNCAVYRADNKVVPVHCDSKFEWICKMPKGMTPKIPEWHVRDIPWVFFQGYEYLFYDQPFQFLGFEFVCAWLGSERVTIHSPAEQAFIYNRIKKISKKRQNWWIGHLHESPHDGLQRWTDGLPMKYTNWEGAFDITNVSLNVPQCAYISSDTGLWGFSECSALNPGICRTDKTFKVEKETYTFPMEDFKNGTCPPQWIHYGRKCFFVHKGEDNGILDSWFDAQEYCNSHGGNLVCIENEIEQAFVVIQLFGEKNGFWINLRNSDYEKWESGLSRKYSNWSPVESIHEKATITNGSSDNQRALCGVISSNGDRHATGKWYLDQCNRKGYGLVCEKRQDIAAHSFNETEMYPVLDIMEYGHKTYKMISGNVTWYEAYTSCRGYGADLVSVTDEYHQAFLTVIINRLGYSHWIGFSTVDKGRHFEWADGSNSTFTAWEDEESPFGGNCAYMDIDGYWGMEDCDHELQGAVCLLSKNNTGFVDHPVGTTINHEAIPVAVASFVTLLGLLFLGYVFHRNKRFCSTATNLPTLPRSQACAEAGETEELSLLQN
ncbi:secretory phospholipase A2 receptor [Spea bombifrons]|uniref:secretory phospholipase A2 receptor n=1 Tax=Spea bombifrons TaxID=233779 RepID=UPI00234BD466|nr:secretory phospholipase A2 receptor [Spea bombifrons]